MRKQALLIGVNQYDMLGTLRYARKDAEAFAQTLQAYCGFDASEVTLLTCDAPGLRLATQRYIERALGQLAGHRNLDLLVFGFWGHGFLTTEAPVQRYLCGRDSLDDDLRRTAVPLDLVRSRLSQVSAENTLLLLDCCQERAVGKSASAAGATRDEMNALRNMARDILAAQQQEHRLSIPTVAVLNACSEGQKAYEWDEREHGVFTAHLLEMFEEGCATVGALASEAALRVVKTARELGHDQRPFITIEGNADFRLAHDRPKRQVSHSTPRSTETQWYYIEGDRELGPVSEGDLLARIKADTEVWNSNLRKWTLATAIPELRGKLRLPHRQASLDITPPKHVQDYRCGDKKTVEVGEGVTLELVWIPPGSYMMGSLETEKDRNASERPQHPVTFSRGFWLGKYPVTQSQWQAVMGNNPSYFTGDSRLPVTHVNWDDCQAFVRKLNQCGKNKFALPSEAEWEYACRAGTKTGFYWGDATNKEYMWYCTNSRKVPHAVGQKRPNQWGLYDMSGNVYEWCEDDWHSDYGGAPSDGRAWVDSPRGTIRVLRGGYWYNSPDGCRSASRLSGCTRIAPAAGFRLLGIP